MRMAQAPQYCYFGFQVIFELFIQLVHVDRLDGDCLSLFLENSMLAHISDTSSVHPLVHDTTISYYTSRT